MRSTSDSADPQESDAEMLTDERHSETGKAKQRVVGGEKDSSAAAGFVRG